MGCYGLSLSSRLPHHRGTDQPAQLVTDLRLTWASTLQAGAISRLVSGTGSLRDAEGLAEDLTRAGLLTREVSVAPHTYGQAWRSVVVLANAKLMTQLEAPDLVVDVAIGIYGEGRPTVTGTSSMLADNSPDTAIKINHAGVYIHTVLTVDAPPTQSNVQAIVAQFEALRAREADLKAS